MELSLLEPMLTERGYQLEPEQPHLGGERYLMQAMTTQSGRKLILYGTDKTGTQVVIKATRDQGGKAEIQHERTCRDLLNKIEFAAEVFHTPREADFLSENGFIVSIQTFIEQSQSFTERPLEEQFAYALKAFKAQEGAHATTARHYNLIKKNYELRNSNSYLTRFAAFKERAANVLPEEVKLHELYEKTEEYLTANQETIERYCGFLTHTDFVPHNFRIDENGIMYLLDHSSLAFGNKYEGWARFLNFMTLYNPPLTDALAKYVADNRSEGEVLSLHLMRLYRLGEIICYYLGTLERSEDNLHTLNRTRVDFWATVLSSTLNNTSVPDSVINLFKQTRDSLRTEDEKRRQQGLH